MVVVLLQPIWFHALANSPPQAPVILEPADEATGIHPADVHMATAVFSDPDERAAHRCSEWEIRQSSDSALVWKAACAEDALAVHIHLGDGSYEKVSELSHDTGYIVRVRHRDDSGDPESEWSVWSERRFTTGAAFSVYPMTMAAVMSDPAPLWLDSAGDPILMGPAEQTGALTLERVDGSPLASFSGSVKTFDPDDITEHHAVRVRVRAGDHRLSIPESTLEFRDENLALRRIYLAAVLLEPLEQTGFWVSSDGSTYHAVDGSQPEFISLARGAPAPWATPDHELRIERIAGGFQLPVDLAFRSSAGAAPDDPWLYVAELYGNIKVIARNGAVSDYATDLLGFDGEGPFPGKGEQGIGGIAVEELTGDLFVALPQYEGERVVPRVIRLSSDDGGRTASSHSVVLELTDINHVSSHQISNVTIGPDRKLYVHVGDGFDPMRSQEPGSFHGKILRLELDGTPLADNPLFDASNGITAHDYLYAMGLRNPFGGAWRSKSGTLHVVDNGPLVDRIVEALPGRNFMWDGTDESMSNHALYLWSPSVAPVRMAFIQTGTFDGSGFDEEWMDTAVVTESGATWAEGPQRHGKRLTLFRFAEDGSTASAEPIAIYEGAGRGTAAAVAAGPGGIYFSDLYRDYGAASPLDSGSSIFRIRQAGSARFLVRMTDDPMTVEVEDRSNLRNVSSWQWMFGEGFEASGPVQRHTFGSEGLHRVRLRVASESDDAVAAATISVRPRSGNGLLGWYYTASGDDVILSRNDATLDFDWSAEPPHPRFSEQGFRILWTGEIEATLTGMHWFHLRTDDRVRLWVGGEKIISDWPPRQEAEKRGSIHLEAGQRYPIRIEYFQDSDSAGLSFLWSSQFHGPELVPAGVLHSQPPSPERRRGVRRPRGSTD